MPAAITDASQIICEVWASNVEEEMRKIRQIIQSYNYIAMDTEFPGVVVRPIGEFRSTVDYQYQLLRCNVDLLKIIQLGLTFMNEDGDYPPGTTTWQFNFKFNLTEDMYSQDSIDLLQNSGLQFKKHEEEGIDTLYFAELLMTSGLVLCENVKWLSFHSGYDFGYLVKLLTDARLPEEEHDFFQILNLFFPAIYDVKYLMKSCKNLKMSCTVPGASKKAQNIIRDPSHPGHKLFELLPSGRRYRTIKCRTNCFKNTFYPRAIVSLNTRQENCACELCAWY
ncbi:CCR4-NOT transcription complex subunit 8 isoform X2 [Nerophis ophidion]|uniref:CCR4-NOT transcription complex subunit 8 isoform X2 n=1 Tax=Nerophis ophidion TaxID=159077 RepID=UPI002AE049A2|nr:CCR4-NOT transcription complex subunit 8 isoform X2 [Nerophis ophidion]